jgi:glyoxylase-like metal-dependent hydrolase (beta-lactamase superfamily II)
MTTSARFMAIAAAGLTLALATGSLSGAQAAAPPSDPVHEFKIGRLEAASLWDGGFVIPNNGRMIGTDEGAAKVAEVLKAAGVPTETLALSVNILLLKTPGRVWLFDTGNGPKADGKLMESLTAAGVQPAQVTDVVISHSHGDHVNGLLTATDAPAFPRAKIRMTAAEWAHMKAQPSLAATVRALEPQVETFAPGARLSPEVTAVEIRGHTPGHSGYVIESNGQRLLAIGDTAHHYIVSVREPEFTIQFDADAPTAEASRRALLHRAADQKLSVFAPHFPYPGLGAVRPEGDGFAWVAE